MKKIVLTGASSGIGRALAIELGRRGAELVIAARRKSELESLAQEIAAVGGTAHVLVLDVANVAAVKDGLAEADRMVGGFDTVIANAGVGINDPEDAFNWEDVERMLDVNVRGAFATLVHAIPYLRARGGGQLSAVTSLAGRRGLPASGAYSASKAAVSVFLETLRVDLLAENIRVTDIQPGFVDTPMTQRNRFKMPFIWSAEKAASYISDELEGAPGVIAFPLPLDMVTSAVSMLPNLIYDPLAKMMIDRNKQNPG